MSERARWAYSVSSPILRRYALTMTRRIAERYRDHLALALWHIDNELGCHVPYDYSDDSAAARNPVRDRHRAQHRTVNSFFREPGFPQRSCVHQTGITPKAG
ncbi:beta-galactosidase [Streptosporangium lutulentum]